VAATQIINFLVTITLIEMMVAVGLSVPLADLGIAARNWRLLIRAALSNYVCVPAATIVLLFLVDTHPLVTAGFLILAVCPGAPFGPPLTSVANGDMPIAVGLMVLLAGSSAIVAPIALRSLLPLVSARDALLIDAGRIAITLLFTQILPLCLGIVVRHWWPAAAVRLQPPANLVSKILNLFVVGLILITQFHSLAEIRPRGFAGMIILVIVSWTAGWLVGGPTSDTRKALAVTTSLRNFGMGLVIATSTFAGTPAVTAIVAYGLVSLFGTATLAMVAGRLVPRRVVAL
jgi:BASS family bile acid:Na+ symporter